MHISRRVFKKNTIVCWPLPQLTDIIRHLVDGEGACSGGRGGEGAGVARVPDVGDVGRQRGATGGGGDDAAHSEASSAGPAG